MKAPSDIWSESVDGWSLGLDGFMVTRICVDDAVTLHCTNGQKSLALALEGPFQLHVPASKSRPRAESHELIPDAEPTKLAPVLSLLLGSIRCAQLKPSGIMEVELVDGRRVVVHAEEAFCSWRLTANKETVMMSMPENYAGIRRRLAP